MPRGNESTTKFKADISQLKSAMQEAARQVRLANSEFKAATAGMDNWSKSADGLSAKTKQLNTTLDAQKKQLNSLEEQYKLTAEEQGENSRGAQELLIKINNQKAAIGKTESQLNRYNDKLEEMTSEADGAGDSAEDLAENIGKVETSARKSSDGFTVMKGALAGLVADGIRITIDAIKDLAKETLQVGAGFESSMSQVEAVSGASGKELEKLTDKAKEMGEKTKFSASQSAEAFNYMAMAGWKTEDMMGGIEGVMNLAAASGEDLATTSDIVTDALTAMGYSAKDSGKLADVMAAASSNANTNVSMMGETFKYAASVAGSYGYSMEDVAIATGLMANAGIKGTQSGTAMRSIMTRLSTDAGASSKQLGALGTLTKKLGVAFYDAKGEMRPFGDVIKDTRKAWKGLTKEEQANYGKKIAGQEALSGWLAMMNASEKDVNKLTKAVNNSSGAAEKMAKTMNDNVAGQFTLLKSQIEGKMIKVFEKVAPQLRKGIDQISKALEQVNWDSFSKGLGDFASKAINFFTYVISHGPQIISILKIIGTAWLAMFAFNKYAQIIGSLNSLITTFSSLSNVIDVAKTSQLGLNAAQLASPVGLVVTGVAALAAGMAYASKKYQDQIEKEYGLSEAQQKTIDEINKSTAAYEEMDKARKESNSKITAEYDHLEELKNEYNKLIDKNGQVKKKYKERADFIINELAKSMGIEKEEVQKLIDKNGKLGKSIDDLMLKKKAEALLNANDESYKQAVAQRNDALKKYQKALSTVEIEEKKYEKAKKASNDVMKKYQSMLLTNAEGAALYLNANTKIIDGADEAKYAFDEAKKTLKGAEKAYVGYNSTITNYEGLSSAAISGDVKKIEKAMTNLQNSFISAKDGTKTTLEQQVSDAKATYDALKKAIESKTPGITKAQVDQAKKMVDAAQKELDKATAKSEKAGKKTGEAHAKGIASTKAKNKKAGENTAKAAVDGEKSGGKNAKKTGSDQASNYAKGVNSKKEDAKKAGETLGKKANDGADSYKENAKQSGSYFAEGYSNGIGGWFNKIWDKGKALAKKAWEGLKKGQKEGSPSKLTYQSGVFFTQGYINGITSMQSSLVNVVRGLAKTAVKELTNSSSFNFEDDYSKSASSFAEAMGTKINYTIGKMTYQNEEMLKQFDDTIEDLNTKRDAALAKIESQSASKQAAIEKDRDKQLKTAEKNNTATQKALEAERDKKIKELEKKRDALQTKYNNISSKKEDKAKKAAAKKELDAVKSEISTTKTAYNKKITAANNELKKQQESIKKNAETLINANTAAAKKEQTAIENDYSALIKEENDQKEAYQKASSEMISEFTEAMNDYQTKAQELIDNTIGAVATKYQAKYDELIGKQDNLISKLKSAGDLFEISGAGVITVNDIKAQTQQIKDYTSKLATIKDKVSADLFDQIATYDMKEGSAFIDQLLSMSEADLKAYSDAYDEKMSLSESLSKNIYKSDIDKVGEEYKNALDEALKGLPEQLEELGMQCMQGFLDGLTTNTDYMSKYVKTYVQGMVNQFKEQLGIHSPSKVMAEIGGYTGEGFANGLKDSINYVKKSASSLIDATSASLSDVKSALGSARTGGSGVGGTSVVNNYNLVQNNTSPKSLSALETYQARRQQIALVKAFTQ